MVVDRNRKKHRETKLADKTGGQQCTVGLEGGSRRHSTVRQPDSQGSQTVFLVAPCCSDLTVVYANDVLVYGLTLTRPRFDEDW